MTQVAEVETTGRTSGPALPLGRRVELPGRGTTFVRERPGPPGAPTVVLLHGWMASAGLNWFRVFDPLADHFRVLAPDLRGHGRGLRSWSRFTLAACADDTAATLDALGVDDAVVVGYSMGGPVSQLVWRRHPERVRGLVQCATAPGFIPVTRERVAFQTAMALAAVTTRIGSVATRFVPGIDRVVSYAPSSWQAWAAAEMRRHDVRSIVEAGHAIGTYHSARWLPDVDVPTAVVVTTRDRGVAPHLQARLVDLIPDARVHPFDAGHLACALPDFGDHLLGAALDVCERS